MRASMAGPLSGSSVAGQAGSRRSGAELERGDLRHVLLVPRPGARLAHADRRAPHAAELDELHLVRVPRARRTDAQALVDRGLAVLRHEQVVVAHGVHPLRPRPRGRVDVGEVLQALLTFEAQASGLTGVLGALGLAEPRVGGPQDARSVLGDLLLRLGLAPRLHLREPPRRLGRG